MNPLPPPLNYDFSNIFDITYSKGQFLNTLFTAEVLPLSPFGEINTGSALGIYGKSNVAFNNCTFKNFKGDGFGAALNIYEYSSS